MRIPRLHLFELTDQSWFPATIRDLVTDYLHFIETKRSVTGHLVLGSTPRPHRRQSETMSIAHLAFKI